MKARIIGTGSALPEKKVTNQELSQIVDTSDEWISSRTGIRQRRVAVKESTVSLAAAAAERALLDSGLSAEEIPLIIVATCSPDAYFPSTACQVQKYLGAARAVAFDLSAACSGFLFALHTANAYLAGGLYERALVIGAETLSKLVDWSDRSTCVLFGDGAGAVVLEAGSRGLLGMVQWSDGSKGEVLTCEGRQVSNWWKKSRESVSYLSMDGQEVFKFAVKKVPECIEQVLDQTGTSKEDIAYYILHQANSRIIQSVAKRLQVEENRFPMNLDVRGNTSAASIPILLDEMNRDGRLKRGDKLVLSGFGAGLTWGAAVLEW